MTKRFSNRLLPIFVTVACFVAPSAASAGLIVDRAVFDSSNALLDLAFTLDEFSSIEADKGFVLDLDGPRDGLFGPDVALVSLLFASTPGFSINAVDTTVGNSGRPNGDSAAFAYTGPELTNTQLAFIVQTNPEPGFRSVNQPLDFGLNVTIRDGGNANLRPTQNTQTAAGRLSGGTVTAPAAAIPLPGTLALLGLGMASLGLSARRRRRPAA